MTQLTQDEVTHLATLARLSLSAEETAKLTAELPKIVDFVEQLQAVSLDADIAETEPTPAAKLRADEIASDSLSLEQLETLAPAFDQDQVVVPAVFGEETNA